MEAAANTSVKPPKPKLPRRKRYDGRHGQLKNKRRRWESTWLDIGDKMLPYRLSFNPAKRNSGDRNDKAIINSTPYECVDACAAGIHSGITNPTRDWWSLAVEPAEIGELHQVRMWLESVQRICDAILLQSNWYQVLADGVWPEGCTICTAAVFMEESEEQPGGVHFHSLPVGSYWLDRNHEGVVDTCYRELEYDVRQVVEQFGYGACSDQTKRSYDAGDWTVPVRVIHAVQPNDDYREGQFAGRWKRYSSCWWEAGSPGESFLRESGYDEFPVLVFTWSLLDGDVYGRGPGWKARGDCGSLQHKEKKNDGMFDKTVDPPMKKSDASTKGTLLPGDTTYVSKDGGEVFEPSMRIEPQAMDRADQHIARIERRIQRKFFVHVWQSMQVAAASGSVQPKSATEVEQIRREAMLMMGPLLQSVDPFLATMIKRLLAMTERMDMLPLRPPELLGADVKVKFISVLHQAQQSTAIGGLRTLVGETAALAGAGREDALDKLNVDVIVDEYARITGVRPDVVLSEEEVAKVRAQRAKMQEAQQTGDALSQAAKGMADISKADPAKLQSIAKHLPPAVAGLAGASGNVGMN